MISILIHLLISPENYHSGLAETLVMKGKTVFLLVVANIDGNILTTNKYYEGQKIYEISFYIRNI